MGEGKEVGGVEEGIIGKVQKKEGKDKRAGEDIELLQCSVHICGVIPLSLFIAAGDTVQKKIHCQPYKNL